MVKQCNYLLTFWALFVSLPIAFWNFLHNSFVLNCYYWFAKLLSFCSAKANKLTFLIKSYRHPALRESGLVGQRRFNDVSAILEGKVTNKWAKNQMFNYIFYPCIIAVPYRGTLNLLFFSSESIFDAVKVTKNFGKKYALSEKSAKKSRIIWFYRILSRRIKGSINTCLYFFCAKMRKASYFGLTCLVSAYY